MESLWFWILGWFLTIVAIIGNGLVIYLIISKQRLRDNTANRFIISLGVADFFFSLSAFPSVFAFEILGNQSLRPLSFISMLFGHASITNLCIMTADRYIAITLPLRYIIIVTKRRSLVMILSAWLLSVAVAVIYYVWISSKKYVAVFQIAFFNLLPSVFLILACGRMYFIVRRHNRNAETVMAQLNFNEPPQHRTKYRRKQESTSLRMICAIVFIFVLSYMLDLYHTVCFAFDVCTVQTISDDVNTLLVLVNSASNPIVYTFLKKDVKRELRSLVGQIKEDPYRESVAKQLRGRYDHEAQQATDINNEGKLLESTV